MKLNETQFEKVTRLLARVCRHSPFYREKYRKDNFEPKCVRSPEDFARVPFTTKDELRNAYPLWIAAVPEEEIVRIHSSSGTTGMPVIIPYTAGDVALWAELFKRCYQIAGVTNRDRIQITPGYGLWTAGIGFQAGAEKLGAMAIPMGPGNTQKQLQFLTDMKSTVLAATSSYALLLAEEVARQNLSGQLSLKKAVIGSERWGEKMRGRIKAELGVQLYDIYGLTEVYGPGISISCDAEKGLHYFNDCLYFEIINPDTGENVPDGTYGELVITTLTKEAAPLLRYRTRDITRLLPGDCPCGCPFPRHDIIAGRCDDMVKVKGVNIYPGQIEELLQSVAGSSGEYRVFIRHSEGKDAMLLQFEREAGADGESVEREVVRQFKSKIGITIAAESLPLAALPRSEKKTKRIFDSRYE